jgi:D-proline reductase (dithiol) PrdB
MSHDPDPLGLVPDAAAPIRYIDRTHAWYGALGFAPYRYASHAEVPFAPLRTALATARVALLTTAAPFQPDKGPQDCRAPYNAAAKFYAVYDGDSTTDPDLRIAHVGVDRANLSDDSACWFPLPALRRAAGRGRIGAVAPRFIGVPTNRSQRHTLAVDAPEVLRRCQADRVDAAVLVANCPICHQTLSLTARHLEAAGIATVLIGSAKDIVERCGVPRFVFSDFPLGSAAARPDDPASQDSTLELALALLEQAFAPRTTVQNPLRWSGPPDWRDAYMNLSRVTPEALDRLRAENAEIKRTAHAVRDRTLGEAR